MYTTMKLQSILLASIVLFIAQAYGQGNYGTQVYQSGSSSGPGTLPGVGMLGANLGLYASCLAFIVGVSVLVVMLYRRRKAVQTKDNI